MSDEETLLRIVIDAYEEIEMCDGLIFVCKFPESCTWAHWPHDTVKLWWKYRIIKKDVVNSTDPYHMRCRIDTGQLTFCALMVCSDILLRRHDLIDRLPRLIWRVIEIGKRDERIRSLMHRDASRYVVMQWFAEWIHGPFPPESRNLVLDEWAASLLHTKILSLKEKQNGASQGNVGHDTCDTRL